MSEMSKRLCRSLTVVLMLMLALTMLISTVSASTPVMTKCGIKSEWSYYKLDFGKTGTANVNLFNGNLVFLVNDMTYQNLNFVRAYNSRGDLNDIYGNGWRMSYSRKVLTKPGEDAYVVDSTGAMYTYKRNADGTFSTPATRPYYFLRETANSYQLSSETYNLAGDLILSGTTKFATRFGYNGKYLETVDNMLNRRPVTLTKSPTNPAIEKITDPMPVNTTKVTYTYDTNNNLTGVLNAQNIQNTYNYSIFGRLGQVVDAKSQTLTFTYDYVGRVTSITDTSGHLTRFVYDTLKTTVYPPLPLYYVYYFNEDGTVNHVERRFRIKREYQWERGRVINAGDIRNISFQYNYDLLNRLESIVNPLNAMTFFAYDDNNNLVNVTDPDGIQFNFEYDADKQLTAIRDTYNNTYSITRNQELNTMTVTDPAGQTLTYRLDVEKCLTEVQDMNGTILRKSINPDANTKLTELLDNGGNLWTSTELGYDSVGRLTTVKDLAGNTLTREYDENSNLLAITDQTGATVGYTYTPMNKLETVAYNGQLQYSLTYDEEYGWLKTVAQRGQEKPMIFNYDEEGRLAETVETDGNTMKYYYDEADSLTGLDLVHQGTAYHLQYELDAANQVVTVAGYLGDSIGFAYTNSGLVKDIIYPNGLAKLVQYDEAGRVGYFTLEGSPLRENYTYDGNNNVLSITDANEQTRYFTYNQLNALESETDPYTGERTVYNYDPAGNRINKTVYNPDDSVKISLDYGYAGLGSPVTDGRIFTYGLRGNLENDGFRSYIWNAENRLTEVRDRENQLMATFTYDYQGKRISKVTGKETTIYHYVGNRVAYETDEYGNIRNMYTYSADGAPLTWTRDGVTYYYHTNMRGDVLAITNSYGEMVASYRYDAFGNILEANGELALINPYRFAGAAYDRETGLYYMGGNYYDADAGRYVSKVKGATIANSPLDANGYILTCNNPFFDDYCGNGSNPYRRFFKRFIWDGCWPFHHCPWCPWVPHPWDPPHPDDPWYREPDVMEEIWQEKTFDGLIGWENTIDVETPVGFGIDLTESLFRVGNIDKAMNTLQDINVLDATKQVGGFNQMWQ